jgi:hypothetical protein
MPSGNRERRKTYEVPCGDDVMVDDPERLTEVLLEVTH